MGPHPHTPATPARDTPTYLADDAPATPRVQVWNLTDQPRLVLIMDVWHPMLTSDAQRHQAMSSELERSIYRDVVERGDYKPTDQRGH
jgi:aspartyl/asparaginyl beta-hydroxylase (cupin superfamily)